jgi:hypothetical protein
MNKWQKLGFRKPQDKLEWTMWIGAGFIFLAIILSLIFVKKPLTYPPKSFAILYSIDLLRDIGFGIIASATLISGLIHLKIDGKRVRGYFGVIGGIILLSLMIGRPVVTLTIFSSMQSDTTKNGNQLIEKLSERLNKKDYSLVEKARFRTFIAKEKYLKDGSLTDYLDENGNTRKYSPTREDIQSREMRLTMAQTIRILRVETIFWSIVFVTVLVGSINYIKRRQQD